MGKNVHYHRYRGHWNFAIPCLLLGVAFAFAAYDLRPGVDRSQSFLASTIAPFISSSCNIKGNISMNTGEHIYHVPGQTYYDETRISLRKGERWFCSEAEAISAGWRKSRV